MQPTFYERNVGSTSLGFFELVVVGNRIGYGMKNGKILTASGTSNNSKKTPRNFQKREGEANVMYVNKIIPCQRERQQQFSY